MQLLFYGLKNDRGLRAIYKTACIPREEAARPWPGGPRVPGTASAPAPSTTSPSSEHVNFWVSYSSYSLGRSEISCAAGYIRQVRLLSKQGEYDE